MLILRHAQSEWNLHFSRTRVDPGIPDPALTASGIVQAEQAADRLRRLQPTRILTSPYRRALQTATILAERLDVPIHVDATVRERHAFSCDVGSPPEWLAKEWPGIDFTGLPSHWWGTRVESESALHGRVAAFRDTARTLDDGDRTVVVSHWGFIRALTGHEVDNATILRYDRAVGSAAPI